MRIPRLAALFIAALAGAGHAAGPSGLLNDTGQTLCYDAADAAVACDIAGVGSDAGVNPRQDARFGRDAAQAAGTLPAKTGGGAAGFDFTALDLAGNVVGPGAHYCVKDNVTHLIWSTQTHSSITWDTAGTLAAGYSRCGLAANWRLPTRRELLSIVHNGSSSPAIDTTYFPGTVSAYYWTGETYAPNPGQAWIVGFGNGDPAIYTKPDLRHARFVHDGP